MDAPNVKYYHLLVSLHDITQKKAGDEIRVRGKKGILILFLRF